MRPAVRHVGVLVPVRDEEELLPGCLAALTASAAHLRAARPEVAVRVVVVLDGCTDGSRAVVENTWGVWSQSNSNRQRPVRPADRKNSWSVCPIFTPPSSIR